MIALLLWIGFVRRETNGKIRWPFHSSPWWIWKAHFRNGLRKLFRRPTYIRSMGGWFGFFRNRPEFVKWEHGRLLPARWGFYIVGFEFGDRG